MRRTNIYLATLVSCFISITLSSCSSLGPNDSYSDNDNDGGGRGTTPNLSADYASRLPQHISTGEKTVYVDPNVHAWGAYDSSGNLLKAGLTSAGSDWCSDLGRPCHTKAGSFRVQSLGSFGCKSRIFPIPRGGSPMPYCMYFNGGQGLHGSYEVAEANISHGCVRMHVDDAEWLRFNFVNIGTKVVVKPYY